MISWPVSRIYWSMKSDDLLLMYHCNARAVFMFFNKLTGTKLLDNVAVDVVVLTVPWVFGADLVHNKMQVTLNLPCLALSVPRGCRLKFYCSSPFYWHGLTVFPAWICNHVHYKVWDEITYPFLNFNGCTVEVCNRWNLWMAKRFHLAFYWTCDYLSMLGFRLNHVSERVPRC